VKTFFTYLSKTTFKDRDTKQMGVYVYTMRKRRQLVRLDGKSIQAHLYSYAYKPSSTWWCDRNKGLIGSLETHAESAFEQYKELGSGLVIVGSIDRGVADLEGAMVYRGVTSGIWWDGGDFPGIPVGFIHLDGRNARRLLTVVTELPWQRCDDQEFRHTCCDERFACEVRVDCPDCETTKISKFTGQVCGLCGGSGYLTPDEAKAFA